jgi:hypothetical protein
MATADPRRLMQWRARIVRAPHTQSSQAITNKNSGCSRLLPFCRNAGMRIPFKRDIDLGTLCDSVANVGHERAKFFGKHAILEHRRTSQNRHEKVQLFFPWHWGRSALIFTTRQDNLRKIDWRPEGPIEYLARYFIFLTTKFE